MNNTTPSRNPVPVIYYSNDLSKAPKKMRRAIERARRLEWDFFTQNPTATTFDRPLIDGELPEPMPPGTRIIVKRLGIDRVARLVCPPKVEAN
jgi:hypothetical protein